MTFTATIGVRPGNAAYNGSVQFEVDGSPLGGPVAATNGVATSPSFETEAVGRHTVTASAAETADYVGSGGEMVEVVETDGAAVEVGSTANPAEYGAPFELQAEVVPSASLSLVPGGTVELAGGGSGCTGALAGGRTSCPPAAALAPGEDGIVAHYSGDEQFQPGEGAMLQQVTRARTRTDISAAPAGQSFFGEPVIVAAQVGRANPGSGTPGGSVRFDLDGEALGGPVPLTGGRAEAPAAKPEAGPHEIGATYGGDADFHPSGRQGIYLVLPDPTSTSVTTSAQPAQPGEPVTFTAAVKADKPSGPEPPLPEGTVQFRLDGRDLGDEVKLTGGKAVSPPAKDLKPGRHDLDAIYRPLGANFKPSHARLEQEVDQPTVTVVVSSRNPAPAGAPVEITAHVGPLVTTGTVGFDVDGAPLLGCEAIPVNGEDISCPLPNLSPGPHQVQASYSGAPLFDSSSAGLVETVEPGPSNNPVPTACQLRDVRGRVLVFRSRDAVRLVTRYRTDAPAKVTARFRTLTAAGEPGKLLGTLHHGFEKEGRDRVLRHLPPSLMRTLRRARRGFLVDFTLPGTANFCARRFHTALKLRRQVSGQQVWFEAGSPRADLPPDSR
jgi:hypothetical protein